MKDFNFDLLKGSTISSISPVEAGIDEVRLTLTDGRSFLMYHEQDCCESVRVESVVGNIGNLAESPLTFSEWKVLDGRPDDVPTGKDEYIESETWTVFRLGTVKGDVTIRWLGSSNGYYSESVSFVEVT